MHMSDASARGRAGLALVLACGGTFLSFLDATVANLALPQIADDFSVGVTSLSWVVTAYAIPFAAVLAPAGALADAIGRMRLFLAGVATFTLASLLAAAAPWFEVLLAGRMLQGLGAALLVPASLGLVLAEVPAERRPAAIGIWSAAGALAAATGPWLGGIAIELLGWRVLFCLNLPVGVWLLVRGRLLVDTERGGGRAPDLVGCVLLALSVGALVHGLTEGADRGWATPNVVVVLAGAVVAGAATLVRAARHPRPALRVDLWRSRAFATATGVSLCYGATLYATLLLGVLFLVGVWGYSELEAGLAMTPAALATAVVAVGVGRLPHKPTPRTLVISGFGMLAATNALLAVAISADPQLWTLWLPTGLTMGIGTGLATVGVSSAAALSVASQHFAAATGLVMAARQVGGALGVALLAVVLVESGGSSPVAPYSAVYLSAAAVGVVALGSGLTLRVRNVPPLPTTYGPVETRIR
jgi:EmrB/QacA subfamily drug resistance transporter